MRKDAVSMNKALNEARKQAFEKAYQSEVASKKCTITIKNGKVTISRPQTKR